MPSGTVRATETTTLEQFLRQRLGPVAWLEIGGLDRPGIGRSRENWVFDLRWEDESGLHELPLVMRRDPTGSVLETPRGPEFHTLRALEASSLPVPQVLWMDEFGDELVRPAVIMRRYDGASDEWMITQRNSLRLDHARRIALAHRFPELLAELHALDWQALGLGDVLARPTASPAVNEVEAWAAYADRQAMEPEPELVEIAQWLRQAAPPCGDLALVHGDFRPGNTLLLNDGSLLLLDWEMAHIGDPLEDVGYWCASAFEAQHTIEGHWTLDDFVAEYETRVDRVVDREAVRYWSIVALFKLAGMVLTGQRASCEGRTTRVALPVRSLQRKMLEMIDATVDR